MILNITVSNSLRQRAAALYDQLISANVRAHTNQTLIQLIFDHLETAYQSGWYDHQDLLKETPWEFETDALIKDNMNAMARDGWEFVAPYDDQGYAAVIWRRRRAVRDGQS